MGACPQLRSLQPWQDCTQKRAAAGPRSRVGGASTPRAGLTKSPNQPLSRTPPTSALCSLPLPRPCRFPRGRDARLAPFPMSGVRRAPLEKKWDACGHMQGDAPTPKGDVLQGSSWDGLLPAGSLRLMPAVRRDLKRKLFPKGGTHAPLLYWTTCKKFYWNGTFVLGGGWNLSFCRRRWTRSNPQMPLK